MAAKKKNDPSRRDAVLNLRVPVEVKVALRRAATKDDRTVSSMAVHILRKGLEAGGFLRGE